jgi:hypothetical protein
MNILTSFSLSRQYFKSKIFYQLLYILLLSGPTTAQVCQLPEGFECSLNEPSAYKVITTSKTFSQMITDGDILPQAISGTSPQYLVVCQTITDNLPGWYIFAAGSEIIFLNNTSGMVINSGANLQIRASYLLGTTLVFMQVAQALRISTVL